MSLSSRLGTSFPADHPMVRRLGLVAGRRVAPGLLALVIVASGVGLSGGVASAKSGKSLSYFLGHPCALITRAQVAALFGVAIKPGDPQEVIGGGQCAYNPVSTAAQEAGKGVTYGFAPDATPARVKSSFVGTFTQERMFGRTVYCRGGTAENPSVAAVYVGPANGDTWQLSNSSDTCQDSFKLARLALAAIS
jgi:hypothetical protein